MEQVRLGAWVYDVSNKFLLYILMKYRTGQWCVQVDEEQDVHS